MLNPQLQAVLPEVIKVLKEHKVKSAYAFGSVCTAHFNSKSDIDLLIAFAEGLDPLKKGQSIWDLEDALSKLLHREVDIVTENSLKNPYFIKELNETKVRIYE
jgi:predicted nucleotidyltransferase